MNKGLEGWNLSIRTYLLPKDTNQHGTIFGGVILSYLDIAGAVEARRYCEQEVVTVALKEVVFKEPVMVGDLISFYTRILATGKSSVTTEITVIAIRDDEARSSVLVTNAQVTYVAIDDQRMATPVKVRTSPVDPPAFSPDYWNRKPST